MGCADLAQRKPGRRISPEQAEARLKAKMHSGSVNVICITFGDFTLLDNFCQLFEALTAARTQRPIAFHSP
jgi:hypothetical protein